ATDFVAVCYHVVLVGHDTQLVFVLERLYSALWHAEGVMAEVDALVFLVPLVKRKIDDPGQRHDVWVFEVEVAAKLASERAEHFVDDLALIGAEENDVAVFCAHALLNSG